MFFRKTFYLKLERMYHKVLKIVFNCGALYHLLLINPFLFSVTFLYPLKTSETLWFSDIFRGYRNVTLD